MALKGNDISVIYGNKKIRKQNSSSECDYLFFYILPSKPLPNELRFVAKDIN